jgi:hypothetical protein
MVGFNGQVAEQCICGELGGWVFESSVGICGLLSKYPQILGSKMMGHA